MQDNQDKDTSKDDVQRVQQNTKKKKNSTGDMDFRFSCVFICSVGGDLREELITRSGEFCRMCVCV